MILHSQFVELLYKDFFKSARKKKISIERTEADAVILKTIIKYLYTDKKFYGVYSPNVCADHLKKVLILTEDWSEQLNEICKRTLLLYRKNEDDLRFFDYLLRLSQNTLPESSKVDRRKSRSEKIQLVKIDEVVGQMLDEEKNCHFYINDLELFDQTLNFSSLKKKMAAFAEQFDAVIRFYNEYYEKLPNGLPEEQLEGFCLIKSSLWQVFQELTTAINHNSKSKIEQDLFVFWCHKTLSKKRGSSMAAWEDLAEVNRLIGLKKHLSESSCKEITRNAKRAIAKSKEYQQFDRWVDLS